MKTYLLILGLVFLNISSVLSQNKAVTEKTTPTKNDKTQIVKVITVYDYYEMQRIERVNFKIKTMLYFNNYNKSLPWRKDLFDESGNILKTEIYTGYVENIPYKLYIETIVNNIDKSGNLSGYSVMYYEDGSSKFDFMDVTPSYFWEIGIMEETLVDRIEYIFDKNGNVKERRSYGEHAYPKQYTTETFRYKDNRISSIYDPEAKIEYSYYYDEKGLLFKVGNADDENSFHYYTYEYY